MQDNAWLSDSPTHAINNLMIENRKKGNYPSVQTHGKFPKYVYSIIAMLLHMKHKNKFLI